MTAFLAYVPVLHQGYLQFFQRHPKVKKLYLVDESLTSDFRQLVKDIRALPTLMIKKAIDSLDIFDEVTIISKQNLNKINDSKFQFISPDEDEMHEIVGQYFFEAEVEYDHIFLRWDKKRSLSREEVQPDVKISRKVFDREVMEKVDDHAKRSTDWWRQVGAALVSNGKIIWFGINKHVPNDMQSYSDGDPRAHFQSGEMFELSSSIHAESFIIAEAAKAGFKTEGCDLYSSTFPCPVCAKLIAQAGIKRLYYSEGYSLLDGENVMKSKGVEIIKVEK